MQLGKHNGPVCFTYDRGEYVHDDGHVSRATPSVHLYLGALSIEWQRGLLHRPTLRWDHRGDWKQA